MSQSFDSQSPDEIGRYHLRKLRDYLEYAASNTDLYAERLREVEPSSITSLAEFRRRVPTVSKPDFLEDQRREPPYGTRLAVAESEIVKVYLTSGSSGEGREVWALTREDLEAHISQLAVGFDWIGLDGSDVVVNTRPIGVTAGADWFPKAFERLDANVLNVGPYSTEEKLRFADRFGVTALLATPPYLKRLQVEAESMGIDLSVETLLTASDNFSIEWAEDIEARYGGTLYEEYGVTEGASLWTCGRGAVDDGTRGTIHFYPEFCHYEVVSPDDHSRHVSSGETGELVLTPFCRRGMPVVRFATGDRVTYHDSEECGCDLPFGGIESGTIGRFDDVLRIKGRTLWPQTVDDIVFAHSQVREYVGCVSFDDDHRETASIGVEFTASVVPEEEARIVAELESELSDRTGLTFDVSVAGSPLPDYAAMEDKPDRWTDDR